MDQLSERKMEAALHFIAWQYGLREEPQAEEIAFLMTCVSPVEAEGLELQDVARLVIQRVLAMQTPIGS